LGGILISFKASGLWNKKHKPDAFSLNPSSEPIFNFENKSDLNKNAVSFSFLHATQQ